jgi:hypothetical protein
MFKTIQRYLLVRKLERKLEDYVKTLSPEKQAAARELTKKLKQATPQGACKILVNETARLSEKHMRVTEKLQMLSGKM